MDDKSDQFGENPFRKLNIKSFPEARILNTSSSKPVRIPDRADREQFLRAIQHLSLPQKRMNQGFLLADQCALPQVAKMPKRKKIVKSIAPSAPLPPQPAEEDPFIIAMRSVAPLTGKGRRIAQKPLLKAPVLERENSLEDFMAGKLEFAISSTDEYLEGRVVGLDEILLNRLREGQFSPEAHIDLHGLNASQAFENLRDFMHQAWLKDLRVVLIVTGRGRNSPDGHGILRQKLQTWLTKEPFKRVVMAFCTAKPQDGGPGAIYVLLRRYRKKGPIQWNRIFIDEDF